MPMLHLINHLINTKNYTGTFYLFVYCKGRTFSYVAYPFDWFPFFDSKDLIHYALKTKAHKDCLFK